MPPRTPSKIPEPEDIFSGAGAGKNGPAYPASPETTASIAESPGRGFGRKLVRLIFLAAGAAVIVGAGYFGYHFFFAPASRLAPAPNANVNVNGGDQNANVNIPANVPAANLNVNTNNQQPVVNNPVLAPQDDPNSTVDSDNDGLTDYQEVHVYHTDPLKADTDGDGLSDRDEVMVWHTDPLKVDTDGDGYSDGDEVKNGYNPLGPGKLLTPPVTK